MNDLTHGLTAQPIGQAPLVPGSRWVPKPLDDSPFGAKRNPPIATVLDYRAGWVRYSFPPFCDERAPEAAFRAQFEHAPLEVTAADENTYRPAFKRFAQAKGYTRLEPDADGFYHPHDLHTLWVGFVAGVHGLYR